MVAGLRNWLSNTETLQSIGWYVSIMVDNIAYRLMGRHSFDFDTVVPVQTSVDFSPTRTTVISPVGPVDVNMSFWSPIEVGCSLQLLMFDWFGIKKVICDPTAVRYRI